MSASSISSVSAPLFLSSLHCSEGDESLLADCSHDQIGLASCDETSGLAVARCFGEKNYCFLYLHTIMLECERTSIYTN